MEDRDYGRASCDEVSRGMCGELCMVSCVVWCGELCSGLDVR